MNRRKLRDLRWAVKQPTKKKIVRGKSVMGKRTTTKPKFDSEGPLARRRHDYSGMAAPTPKVRCTGAVQREKGVLSTTTTGLEIEGRLWGRVKHVRTESQERARCVGDTNRERDGDQAPEVGGNKE